MLKKIVKFSAQWCGPCKYFAPIFHQASENEEFKNIEFVDVDIDNIEDDEIKMLVINNKIQSIPTVLFLDGENNVLRHTVGLMTKLAFENTIKELLANG